MINVYFCYFEKKLHVSLVYGIEVGLWILILPFCWFWTYYNSCIVEIEKYGEDYDKLGKKIKRQMIGGTITFFVLVGISFTAGYIKTPENPYIPDLSKAKEFEQSLKKEPEDSTKKEAPAAQTFETMKNGTVVRINSFQSSAMTKSKMQEEVTGVLESKESF